MMILACLRIKLSSLKMNKDRVDLVAMLGIPSRMALRVRLLKGPPVPVLVSPSSCRLLLTWKVAILKGKTEGEKLVRYILVFCVLLLNVREYVYDGDFSQYISSVI